jgi:hypothetical protein
VQLQRAAISFAGEQQQQQQACCARASDSRYNSSTSWAGRRGGVGLVQIDCAGAQTEAVVAGHVCFAAAGAIAADQHIAVAASLGDQPPARCSKDARQGERERDRDCVLHDETITQFKGKQQQQQQQSPKQWPMRADVGDFMVLLDRLWFDINCKPAAPARANTMWGWVTRTKLAAAAAAADANRVCCPWGQPVQYTCSSTTATRSSSSSGVSSVASACGVRLQQ